MKGGRVSQFGIGDMVKFTTKGQPERHGRIHKLHKSCAAGLAEIKPSDGTRKVSRRLQCVGKIG